MSRNWATFRGKYWCFTINNPSDDPDCEPPNVWPFVQYVVWQHESGNEEETEHLQGYVCFTKTMRMADVKKHCHATAHWEGRMGTHSEAKAYCMKQDTRIEGDDHGPWEHGDDTGIADRQGERTDLNAIRKLLDEGKSELEIAQHDFGAWCRNYRAFERYRTLIQQGQREWITHVTVYWGPPGVGKSRRARHEAGADAYWLPFPDESTVWWQGYSGQDVVVIDEFTGWMKRTMMQRLCDSTPLLVFNKGGGCPFLAKRIIITSNDAPSQWWRNIGLGPMLRRLEGEHGTVIHMTQPWSPPVADQPPAAPPHSPALSNGADEPAGMSQAFDAMLQYGLHGTPENEGVDDDPFANIHDQPPLSRCPTCMARVYYPDQCYNCLELLEIYPEISEHFNKHVY